MEESVSTNRHKKRRLMWIGHARKRTSTQKNYFLCFLTGKNQL